MTVSEKLRLVQGLHSHAELFGFNWNDGSDWTWHDVACKIADEIDAENEQLRRLCKLVIEYVSYDRCEGCVCKSRCDNAEIDECWQRTKIRELAS